MATSIEELNTEPQMCPLAAQPTSVSRISDSDYGTSAYTSDEELQSDGENRSPCSSPQCQPGYCPQCNDLYDQPVTLQCGHSLCARCCQKLLEQMVTTRTGNVHRNRIRMGISSVSYSRLDGYAASSRSMSSVRSLGTSWKSPQCPVCGERAKTTPPVPNLELANFINTVRSLGTANVDRKHPAYRCLKLQKFKEIMLEQEEIAQPYRIPECKIAVLGAENVGKTSMCRVQYGNEVLFRDLSGTKNDQLDDEPSTDDRFIIDIMDDYTFDVQVETAHGFVLVYSITDRNSFLAASQLYQHIEEQRGQVPLVLVGAKCDSERKRRVEFFEGEMLAERIGCPFREVSSKLNQGINESFVELLRFVEKKKKDSVLQTQ